MLEGITIVNARKSLDNGGAIYIDTSSPTIRNCRLKGNVADGLFGGGIYCATSNAQIIDCVITGNAAGGDHGMGGGGGIYADLASSLTLVGCTIASNFSAGPSSGGLSAWNATISRTIVWGNCVSVGLPGHADMEGSAQLTCCAVNSSEIDGQFVFNGPQVYSNPDFCDPRPCGLPETGGDYRLQPGSLCLPQSSPCGQLIGALGAGCDAVPIETTTWGRIKSRFR